MLTRSLLSKTQVQGPILFVGCVQECETHISIIRSLRAFVTADDEA